MRTNYIVYYGENKLHCILWWEQATLYIMVRTSHIVYYGENKLHCILWWEQVVYNVAWKLFAVDQGMEPFKCKIFYLINCISFCVHYLLDNSALHNKTQLSSLLKTQEDFYISPSP
jgi:hypothetical protein